MERTAAASRGEYNNAAALRSRMDALAVQMVSLELTLRLTQDQMDALAEADSAVRQKQVLLFFYCVSLAPRIDFHSHMKDRAKRTASVPHPVSTARNDDDRLGFVGAVNHIYMTDSDLS